jgi:hypothetical protein
MKLKSILFMWMLVCASVTLFSCNKDDKDKDDDKGNDNATPYITFKYNGTAYNISGELIYFSRSDETGYAIIGIDASMNMLTITVEHNIEEGKTYDIKCGSPNGASDINIVLTIGILIADGSYVGPSIEKIGELTITKKTADHLSGTFYCKMLKGEITDGKFSAPFNADN